MSAKLSPQLEFSDKYTAEHAQHYFSKHQQGFWRILSNRRENAIARRALQMAGNPASVLDLPSGTGRFWEMLCEQPDRKITAAYNSRNMFEAGMQLRPKKITRRIETFECSAIDIPLPDNAVENIFCMRLVHHIGESTDRIALFREFRRVASNTACISLCVDGNFKAFKGRGQTWPERLSKPVSPAEQPGRVRIQAGGHGQYRACRFSEILFPVAHLRPQHCG